MAAEDADHAALIGKEFNTTEELSTFLQNHALRNGRKYRLYDKSGGRSRKYVCTSGEDCPFVINVNRRRYAKKFCPWYISSAMLEHANCQSAPKATLKQMLDLKAFKVAASSTKLPRAKDLIEQAKILDDINLENQLRTVYEAMKVIREKQSSGEITAYEPRVQLASFVDQFKELNPGSYTNVEASDDDDSFLRAIVVPGVLVRASRFNQLFYALEAGPINGQEYNQLLLIGRDGNLQNITLAAAIVDSASKDNYMWFFQACTQAGLKMDVPIFVDRTEPLLACGKALKLQFVHSTDHIIRDCTASFGCLFPTVKNLISKLQCCETRQLYDNTLQVIRRTANKDLALYFEKIDPEQWALFPNITTRPLYSWNSSNLIEAEMTAAQLDHVQNIHPVLYFESVLSLSIAKMYDRSCLAKSWIKERRQVTPGAEELFEKERQEAVNYDCLCSSEVLVYVSRLSEISTVVRRVDLEKKTCSCKDMVQNRIPCRHYCAALTRLGKFEQVYDAFGSEYQICTYAEAYLGRHIEKPLQTDLDMHNNTTTYPKYPKRKAPASPQSTNTHKKTPKKTSNDLDYSTDDE
ncbi:hypothetical protein THRCLA_20170 [Thraustotheca clavata]|uniref:SWIM-type domain-containing protein n=1 Tax=Thraustotheca clavata TaxID=74557 RepID=A0A1W0AAL8_9STRA|nr:hypothetical protein THRCLA_20170 [Thraustotheca clavata]